MNQLSIDFESARAIGEYLGEKCADKAERVADFDRDGAGRFILGWLVRHGPQSGEVLTQAAIEHGFRCHDARSYGPVYAKLVKRGLIRCVGYCARARGHGTSGGRVWAVAQ